MTIRLLFLIFTFLLFSAGPLGNIAFADYESGLAAFERGDYATALKEFLESAHDGEAKAQYYLGLMYDDGLGIPEDDTEAVRWYRLAKEQLLVAADQEDVEAQFRLGQMYFLGQGVPQDYTEAVKWWHLAADKGFAWAQYNLGAMYQYGYGVPVDYVLAYMWFDLADRNKIGGFSLAVKARKALRKKMTRAQRKKAKKLSQEWLEEHR